MNAIFKSKEPVVSIQARVERITPESARSMLSKMVVNRPLKSVRVELFAQAMRENVFDSLNGETLIINDEGRLEDGQHPSQRLSRERAAEHGLFRRSWRESWIWTDR